MPPSITCSNGTSLAEREERWNAFEADPEWHRAKAESEVDGPIVGHFENYMLKPTAYSAVK